MTPESKQKVQKLLDETIRPALRADGGDIELVEVGDDGVVKVRLTGACSGCPFSAMTLAVTVERTLKNSVAEVTRVEPVP